MDSVNYLEIIPNKILCIILAYIPTHYLHIFIIMTCKDIALKLAASINSDDKPLKNYMK
jgi:hypothetical protein